MSVMTNVICLIDKVLGIRQAWDYLTVNPHTVVCVLDKKSDKLVMCRLFLGDFFEQVRS